MNRGLFNRRMPTVFALLILVVIVGISTYLVQQGAIYISKATPSATPQNISITNVSDSSFTVVFTTVENTQAAITLTEADTSNTLTFDDRDKSLDAQRKYYSHHITITDLLPDKTYNFEIISEGENFTDPSYSIKTSPKLDKQHPSQNNITGIILNPDGSPGDDVLVTLSSESSAVLSSITNSKGEFTIPMHSLRNSAGNDYVALNENDLLTIKALKQSMKGEVKASYSSAQTLPPITLSQQYIFITDNATNFPQSSQFDITTPQSKTGTFSITVPEKGETFTDLQPIFKGTAIPKTIVSLAIPNIFNKSVMSDKNGAWSFRPETPISPGRYSLNATSFDTSGNPLSASSNFVIFPQGSQINAADLAPSGPVVVTSTPTRTPSPSPTSIPPTITPTSQPSPSTTISISPSPSSNPTPTPSPTTTPSPTITPTSTPTTYISPTRIPTTTQPGSYDNTIVLSIVSFALIIGGIAILFAL